MAVVPVLPFYYVVSNFYVSSYLSGPLEVETRPDQAYLFTVDASKYRILYIGSVEVGVPFLLYLFQIGDFVLVRYRSCKAKLSIRFPVFFVLLGVYVRLPGSSP